MEPKGPAHPAKARRREEARREHHLWGYSRPRGAS